MTAPGDELVELKILASHRMRDGRSSLIGRVDEAGSKAASLEGKTVLVGPYDPCGECDVCRRGGAAVCPHRMPQDPIEGGTHAIAAARWCVPLDGGLKVPMPGGAAVAGDVNLAYTLYARTGIQPRDPVVLVGASPVTRFLVEILLAKAIAPIVVVDDVAPAPWTAWLLQKSVAVAGDREAVTAAIAAQGVGGRAARVIATTPEVAGHAATYTDPRSTLTILAPVDNLPGELAAREVVVIPVAGPHPDLVVEVAAMCAKGEIDLVAGTAQTENAEMRAIVRVR
jgi:D-arabinose 1-dehydrogenase-like Zn-dependent alcohol dehydrogenase